MSSEERPAGAAPATAAGIATHLMVIFGMFVWGAMTPLVYLMLRTWDAYTLSALRYSVAAPLMILILCCSEGWRSVIPTVPWRRLWLLGAIGIGGLATLSTLGLYYSDPVTAVVVQCCGPVVAVFIARVFYRIPLQRGISLSLSLSVAGALLTLSPKFLGDGPGFRGGELLLLMATACWTWYSLACQKWLKGWSQIRVTAVTLIPAAITLWVIDLGAVALGGAAFPIPRGTPDAILLLVGTAAFSTSLGILIWHQGVTRLGLPVTSLYTNLQPVFAVLVVMAIGIWPTWQQLAGGVLVIIGVTQMRFWRAKP